jgi:pimeloyl-ACP methyl ester carboxylesterase
MPKVEANHVTFHVQSAGTGPHVVLVHGLTGDLSVWFLCQAMSKLGERWTTSAYDLRGHGYSSVPQTGYTSADHAADLLALLDALDIGSAHLVGHSFGAVIALHAATLQPARVRSLVLSDPYFPALRHLEDMSRWGHWQNFRKEASEAGVHLSNEHWYDLSLFFDQIKHLDGDSLLRFRQAVGLPALNRLVRLSQTTCGDDTKAPAGLSPERIASARQPALALYGEHSPFLSTGEYLVEHLPNCRLERVPGAKHRAPEEAPDAFVECVQRFLLGLESGSEDPSSLARAS